IFAGLMSGSVSIISEAIHSSIDLVAALMAYFSIKQADKPADHLHPFGHGKYENLSAFAESLLIIIAALFIIYEAVLRMFSGSGLTGTSFAIIVMAISTMVNFFVSRYLFKIAKLTDSMALEADGKHLSTDVYSSLGVFIGLAIVAIT
ncbi:MAG: cation diffusion facilitator family transporter, partial [Nitrospirae bacterium]|nr:cation diffusion facilitator family transporter [Nitrospirota bacterium]